MLCLLYMNKIIPFIALGAIIVGAIIILVPKQQSALPTQIATTSTTPASGTQYLPYSKQIFDQSADKKRVLFFYANWCPICRPIDAEFSANMNKIPQGVVIIRVNYNDSDTDAEEKALAAKYAITYQHTFVQIDAAGNQIALWNGGGLAELLKNIK